MLFKGATTCFVTLKSSLVTCSFQSQHSSSSSVDSVEKMEEKQAPSNTPPYRQPNFLSEMKVVLGKQAQPVDNKAREGGEGMFSFQLKKVPVNVLIHFNYSTENNFY